MGYAILRIKKHKSVGSLVAAERHGKERDRLNLAYPERTKENRIYKKYPGKSLADSWRADTANIKVRKNAVVALEIVLTFSPDCKAEIEARKKEWLCENMNWIANNFGGRANILQGRIEFDERILHAHILVLPLDEAGKLNAREFVGGAEKLSKLQDSYAQAMAQFGLERGFCYYKDKKKEKPYNKPLKQFYAEEAVKEAQRDKG